jgi:hypothetical protein
MFYVLPFPTPLHEFWILKCEMCLLWWNRYPDVALASLSHSWVIGWIWSWKIPGFFPYTRVLHPTCCIQNETGTSPGRFPPNFCVFGTWWANHKGSVPKCIDDLRQIMILPFEFLTGAYGTFPTSAEPTSSTVPLFGMKRRVLRTLITCWTLTWRFARIIGTRVSLCSLAIELTGDIW